MPGLVDPLAGYHFHVEIKSIFAGAFRECSGISSENEVIEYKGADEKGNSIVQKIPGRQKWDNITLKRGMTNSMELWKWRKLVEEGKVEQARQNGSIVVYNQANTEVARFNFERAWPSKISGPSLNAGNNEVAVEELVIVHEFLERIK
jgi:phage tail-like protein